MVIRVSVVDEFKDLRDYIDSFDGIQKTFEDWDEATDFAKLMISQGFDVIITTWRNVYEQQ